MTCGHCGSRLLFPDDGDRGGHGSAIVCGCCGRRVYREPGPEQTATVRQRNAEVQAWANRRYPDRVGWTAEQRAARLRAFQAEYARELRERRRARRLGGEAV